jgi:shikimate dehydrogenase
MTPITGRTRFMAILADPIHHVMTPPLINALCQARGQDAVMVPMHVRAEALAQVVRGLKGIESFDGFIATVPHKTAMPALCDALTDEAAQVGAVNVVRRMSDGRLLGGLLDGTGFVAGLREHGIEPAGLRVYLAGAGGAGSAIAFALAAAGVKSLTISNRNAERARELIARLARVHPALDFAPGSPDPAGHDLVVNGTSLGLRPDDPLPLDASRLHSPQIVAEIIMQPPETALMAAARARGCRVHPGLPMLTSQIALMAAFMRGEASEAGGPS